MTAFTISHLAGSLAVTYMGLICHADGLFKLLAEMKQGLVIPSQFVIIQLTACILMDKMGNLYENLES